MTKNAKTLRPKKRIQWGSEIWTSLLVKKRLSCEWFGFQMGSEIGKPNHLKSGQIGIILYKKTFEPTSGF